MKLRYSTGSTTNKNKNLLWRLIIRKNRTIFSKVWFAKNFNFFSNMGVINIWWFHQHNTTKNIMKIGLKKNVTIFPFVISAREIISVSFFKERCPPLYSKDYRGFKTTLFYPNNSDLWHSKFCAGKTSTV